MINDRKLLKQIKQASDDFDSNQKVGSYDDLKSADLFMYFGGEENKPLEELRFNIPSRRKDNHEISSYLMASYDTLIERGLTRNDIQEIVNKAVKKGRADNIRMKFKGLREKNKVGLIVKKPIKTEEYRKRDYSDWLDRLNYEKRKSKVLLPYKVRKNKGDFTVLSFQSNVEILRLRTLISRTKVPVVFITTIDKYDNYCKKILKNTACNLAFEYAIESHPIKIKFKIKFKYF